MKFHILLVLTLLPLFVATNLGAPATEVAVKHSPAVTWIDVYHETGSLQSSGSHQTMPSNAFSSVSSTTSATSCRKGRYPESNRLVWRRTRLFFPNPFDAPANDSASQQTSLVVNRKAGNPS